MSTTVRGNLDIEGVRLAARGKWFNHILPAVGFDVDILDGSHGPCPWCGGTNRFRAIDEEAGAVFCNQCFSEENGSGFDAVMKMKGGTFPQAVETVAGILGISKTRTLEQSATENIVDLIARLKRMPPDSFRAFGAKPDMRGKLVVARVPQFDQHRKECSYQDYSDVSDEFLKGINAKGMPQGLFVAEWPKPGDTVCVVEGVKDAAALRALGFIVIGLPTSKLAAKFARLLADCHLLIISDLDTTGQDSAQLTAARTTGIAASVRIVRLPGEVVAKDGDGVREILRRPKGEELLRQAIADAKLWEPAPLAEDPTIGNSEWTSLRTDQGRTDRANSRRLIQTYGDIIRYCHPWGKWLVWNGSHWQVDDSGAVMRLAMAIADKVWMDAKNCLTKEVADYARKTSSRGSLKAMLELAAAELSISVKELDSNPWLLNCPNGTIDLRTGVLRPHRREDYITKLCPTAYKPGSDAETFFKFMESLFEAYIVVQYLQRYFGYCLSGSVTEQILTILYGTGSNGKSTLLSLIMSVLGPDYTAAAPASLLLEKKAGESHPTELAGLFGKRFVVAQETSAGSRLAEATVKQLTGGDPITARRMREDFWEYLPTHKLAMATNHRPGIKGTDHAIWRRVVLIPFERKFWNPDKGETGPEVLQQDKALPAKLANEREGVLAWMVQGCIEWQQGGLQIPDCVRAATEEYRSEEDTVGRFIGECCLTGQSYRVKFSSLFTALEEWCNDSGANLPSRKLFGQWLKDHDYKDKHSMGRWYLGIGLKNEI